MSKYLDNLRKEKRIQPEIATIKCSECGGALQKSLCIEGSGEDEAEVPIAKCISCGKEYDRHTVEYYGFFADIFRKDKDDTIFHLGLKGELDGIEYEIVGRVRDQKEEEFEPSIRDKWLAVAAGDGSFHWFVEEDEKIFRFSGYVPKSINLKTENNSFGFEGRNISKETGFTARIVFSEGEPGWKPEIGDSLREYDFKRGGTCFKIEQSGDVMSISAGKAVPYKKILRAFRKDEYRDEYEATVKKRRTYRLKALVYLLMSALSLALIFRAGFSGKEMKGVMQNMLVITDNEIKPDEKFFHSGVILGPVDFKKSGGLYEVRAAVNENLQPLRLEWQSFRLMLIRADRLQNIIQTDMKSAKQKGLADIKELLEDVDILQDPLESYVFEGHFRDKDGNNERRWHGRELNVSRDFILEDPGSYYLYLDVYSEKSRRADAIDVSVMCDIKSYRYLVAAFIILLFLMLVNRHKSQVYNELPFSISGK